MRFKLSAEDRERLGAPEWIEYDHQHLSVRDARVLDAAGADWRAWGGRGLEGLALALWLALHKAGKAVPFDELDFDLFQIEFASPGKAPSTRSSSSTRSTSATRRTGTSSRKTSKS